MPNRPRFDPKRPLVAARAFTFLGKDYGPGDPFAPEGVDQRMLARQYEARAVNHGEAQPADETPADQLTMTGPAGGRYTITAPWLEEPEVVRGKANAEKRLAELREAGEPDSHHGYTLTAGENGWWKITKDGVEGADGAEAPVLNVQGEDNARQVVAQLRAGETPEDTALPAEWSPAEENDDQGGTGEGGEASDQQPPADQETGGETKESDVTEENERKPEDGDKPNEPETNQPNGAEVINDRKVADGTADEANGDEGDESAGTVGP